MAIRNAWARTLILSSNETLQEQAENAKKQMQEILKNVQNYEEERYANEVYSAIESTFRNLATARNHFTLNLKELKERRTKNIEDLNSTTSVSLDFQSLITRVSAITFGGTGGLTIWGFLSNFIQGIPGATNVDTVLLPFLLVCGAGAGYLIHRFGFVPATAKKIQRQLIKTDYDRIKYYTFYVERVKSALENLHDTTNTLYKNIYGLGDYPNLEKSKAAVNNVLKSMDMGDFVCKYVDDHIHDKNIEIDGDTWVICETGICTRKCKHWK